MLPTYWPLLLLGTVLIASGVGLSVFGHRVAMVIAVRMQSASAAVRGVFMLSPKAKTIAKTASYLTDMYRVVGVIWTMIGVLLLYVVFYGKPPSR